MGIANLGMNHNLSTYLMTYDVVAGVVPGVKEANKHEPLLPWGRYHQGRVVLGSRVEAACATPADLQHAAGLYRHEKFILCFRADTKKVRGTAWQLCKYQQGWQCLRKASSCVLLLAVDAGVAGGDSMPDEVCKMRWQTTSRHAATCKLTSAANLLLLRASVLMYHHSDIIMMLYVFLQVHILLRQGAQPTDCLKAAFSAHVLLHMLDKEHAQAAPAAGSSSSSAADTSSLASTSSSVSSSSNAAALSAAADSSTASSSSDRKGLRRLFGGRSKQASKQEEAAAAAAAAAAPLTGAALVRETWKKLAIALPWNSDPGSEYYHKLLERSKCAVDSLYSDFSRQADRQGWKLGQTMLNPKEARLLKLQLSV
jgi:hypothetical protein